MPERGQLSFFRFTHPDDKILFVFLFLNQLCVSVVNFLKFKSGNQLPVMDGQPDRWLIRGGSVDAVPTMGGDVDPVAGQ